MSHPPSFLTSSSSSSSSSFSPLPIRSGSDTAQAPPTFPSTTYNQQQRQLSTHRLPPPRLPSPRIFREIFTAQPGAGGSALPPARFHDTMQDVRTAFERANRALMNAQQAFTSQSQDDSSEVVDLTASPPNQLIHPAHLANLQRRRSTHEPTPQSSFASYFMPRMDNHNRAALNEADDFLIHSLGRAREEVSRADRHTAQARTNMRSTQPTSNASRNSARERYERSEEQRAIRRQRLNQRIWQQTQSRTQQHLNLHQQRDEQDRPSSSSSQQTDSLPQVHASRHSSESSDMSSVQAVDLTAVDDDSTLAEALSKQRTDAVASQKSHNSTLETGRTALTAYKCPICMDTPKDATTTICGHLFCHQCIIESLKFSTRQRQNERSRKATGVCPVCRKALAINDRVSNARTLVPLELKFVTKKRKREDKGKEKARDTPDDERISPKEEGNENDRRRTGKGRKSGGTEDDRIWDQFMID